MSFSACTDFFTFGRKIIQFCHKSQNRDSKLIFDQRHQTRPTDTLELRGHASARCQAHASASILLILQQFILVRPLSSFVLISTPRLRGLK